MDKNTALDTIIIRVNIFTKVNSGMIKRMVKELSTITMEISIQGNG